MTDHPATINSADLPQVDWDDHATIHANGDGGGVFDGLKALHHGTLAQMVSIVAALPAAERLGLVIQKSGDHRLDADEIAALAERPDFPG